MTPTLSLILAVALFWTLPASGAVLLYRYDRGDLGGGRLSAEKCLFGKERLSC